MIMTRTRRLSSLQSLCFKPTRSALAIAISLSVGTLSAPAIADDVNPFAVDVSNVYISVSGLQSRAAAGPDSDGDGIRNQDDLDDDNDGITDILEGGVDNDGDGFADNNSVDTDGDGAPDYLDLDSDNDGILDNMEARTDRNAVMALDQNPNGAIDIGVSVGSNGLADTIETFAGSGVLKYPVPDTDHDGIPDFRDTDSDNDGIFDVIEAGGVDNDTDGRLDGFFDQDGKGVDDTVQSSALPLFDTDGDGVMDFRDLDSDGDTLSDRDESGGNGSKPRDTDNDGAPDYRETDSDGDGIGDREAAQGVTQPPVADNGGNGSDDEPATGGETHRLNPDRDDDGIPNVDDLDDDNDTILDSEEGIIDANGDGFPDANSRDSDGDGTPDGNDLDSDNDGILDILEARLSDAVVAELDPVNIGAVDIRIAVGANGIPDRIESAPESGVISEPLFDTDNDGTPDYMDVDSDNDGISDLVEAGGVDVNGDGRIDGFVDADTKGVDDSVQASALPRFDTDGDGIRDYRDADSDSDTISDRVESGGNYAKPTDTDGDGAADYREQDSDNDKVADLIEVGPDTENPVDTNGDGTPDFQDASVQYTGDGTVTPQPVEPPQTGDHDNDGLADAQDPDDDNDGITDVVEGSGDADSDGVPNRLDRDSDNDGVLDSVESANDTDGDTIANYLDLDSDNDGLFDALEAGYKMVSSSGRLASAATVDANGVSAEAGAQPVDTDRDSVVDMLDLDSDNDGLLDLQEAGFTDSDLNARIDNFTDANKDGAHDSLSGLSLQLLDTDHDRIADIRDLDSDQDSLSDILENFGTGNDQDNDGRVDNFIDSNGDGLDDNIAAQLAPLTDSDGDGVPNHIDLDSDGDGISDLVEAGGADTNNDRLNDMLADSDGDGIPDVNDADVTGGSDLDNDSIDDRFDSDFVAGADTDGDGIVDSADPDADGNGFVGPLDDATDGLSQGTPVTLPDTDANGVPDINQGRALSDVIETGLGGTGLGCSIGPVGSTSKPDPMLAFLIAGSVMFLGFRRRAQTRRTAALAVIVSATALGGCGVIDTRSDRNFENRVYVGAGLLGSQLDPDTDGVAGTSVDNSQSAGLSGTVGYDINNRFSVEGHLAMLGEATLDPAGSISYNVGGISGIVYGLNEPYERSRREGFGVYGRVGLGAMANSAEVVDYRRVNDLHLLLGAGLEYGLDNGVGLRAELVAHETDAKYVQLGVVYRFGEPRRSRPRPAAPKAAVEPVPEPAVLIAPAPTPEPAPVVVPAPEPIIEPVVEPRIIAPVDEDDDGVLGVADLCPDTAPGLPVKTDGCPLFDGVVEGIEFETGSDTLTVDALVVLGTVAETLRDNPGVRVTVEAHTDNLGNAADNLQLSKRRAIAVARFLVDQGVSGSRLKPQAFGESKPRTSNLNAAGRASNRRVEFTILQ